MHQCHRFFFFEQAPTLPLLLPAAMITILQGLTSTTTPKQAISSEQRRRPIDGGNNDEGILDVREKLMHDL